MTRKFLFLKSISIPQYHQYQYQSIPNGIGIDGIDIVTFLITTPARAQQVLDNTPARVEQVVGSCVKYIVKSIV